MSTGLCFFVVFFWLQTLMVQPYEELLLEIPWILFPLPWHKACGLDLFFFKILEHTELHIYLGGPEVPWCPRRGHPILYGVGKTDISSRESRPVAHSRSPVSSSIAGHCSVSIWCHTNLTSISNSPSCGLVSIPLRLEEGTVCCALLQSDFCVRAGIIFFGVFFFLMFSALQSPICYSSTPQAAVVPWRFSAWQRLTIPGIPFSTGLLLMFRTQDNSPLKPFFLL